MRAEQVSRLTFRLREHRDQVNNLHRTTGDAYIDFGQVNENEGFFDVVPEEEAFGIIAADNI